jgi:hypothetical protein
MYDARRDEQSTLARPESLDFVTYEIDGNGNNGSDELAPSNHGGNGHTTAVGQIPPEYRLGDSDVVDTGPSDDWQECISIVEQGCNTPEVEAVHPVPQAETFAETPESPTSPAQTILPAQQDALPRSNSIPALGPISDLLKTRPASMQQTPQPLPVLPERRPVTAQPVTAKAPGGNGRSTATGPSARAHHVPARHESELLGGTQLISLYERGQRDFSGAILRKANLRGANLPNARMIMADLQEANLSMADLSGARLIQSNLAGANLQAANLVRAKLTGADLREADLRNADLEDAELSGVDLRGANLLGANLLGARLTGANLDRARLSPNWELVWQIVRTENGKDDTA